MSAGKTSTPLSEGEACHAQSAPVSNFIGLLSEKEIWQASARQPEGRLLASTPDGFLGNGTSQAAIDQASFEHCLSSFVTGESLAELEANDLLAKR